MPSPPLRMPSSVLSGGWRGCGAGSKASATVQPFTIVPLDISADVVRSVEDALQLFAAPETLDGYRAPNKTEVAASKLLKIATLPRVLVLHLMRFSFSGERGSTKVHKPVKFPPTLTIPVKLLTSPPAPAEVCYRYNTSPCPRGQLARRPVMASVAAKAAGCMGSVMLRPSGCELRMYTPFTVGHSMLSCPVGRHLVLPERVLPDTDPPVRACCDRVPHREGPIRRPLHRRRPAGGWPVVAF